MAPLAFLVATFLVARFALSLDARRAGRVAMAVMLCVTGAAHFAQPEGLVQMMPEWVPGRLALVLVSGVVELAFAWWLVRRPSAALGFVLAAFYVSILPVNVYSAVAEAGMAGHGAGYLWFRVPLQIVFIAWALWSTSDARGPHVAAA